MTKVFLVRHAHADFRPDEERPLSVGGAADAQRVAELLGSDPITAIYSSPSRRALQTIQPLAELLRLEPQIVADLRERELSTASVDDFHRKVEASWRAPDAAARGDEANSAAQGRALAVVGKVLEAWEGGSVVISTHGNLLSLILHGLDASFGYDFWRSLTFPDVYELSFSGRSLSSVHRLWRPGGA